MRGAGRQRFGPLRCRAGRVAPPAPVDLDRVERDLEGVEAALDRLDAGTYWTDEVTGAPLGDDLLAADPVARRAPGRDEA